ncbi:MAG TPA: hypothetical protein VMH38_04255 [Thermoplasmata archaeon]|nr:hypothetical protein [Thermoplasmata archaeon]
MSNSTAIAISLLVLSVIALLLSVLVLSRYVRETQRCHLYWGVGLLLFFVTLVQEAVLDLGVWSQLLIQSYLILVAVLVGILSLGSAQLSLHGRWRPLYFGYIGATSAALVVVGLLVTIPTSIVAQGVVSGVPPTSITVLSSLVTVPAALLLILSSLYGVVRQRRYHLLYIAVGTAVISAAGALYLVSFPVSLYYAEFVGMLLLFLGFVRIPHLARSQAPQAQPAP